MPATPIFYPATLPWPESAPMQWAERRLLSELPGARQSRVASRDRLGNQQLAFVMPTFELVQEWVAWGETTLGNWGHWFAASWPQPQGGVGVRRFLGAPSYPEYLAKVGWRVTATVEMRGRGELPILTVSNCAEALSMLDLARNEANLVFEWWLVDPSPLPEGLIGSYVSAVRDPGVIEPGSSFTLYFTVAWNDLADLPTVNLINLNRSGSSASTCSYVITVTDLPTNQVTACKACVCQTTGHWTADGTVSNGAVILNGEALGNSTYVSDVPTDGFLLGNLLLRNEGGTLTGGLG